VEEEAGAVDGVRTRLARKGTALLGQIDNTRSSAGGQDEQPERADAVGDGRVLLAAPAGRARVSPKESGWERLLLRKGAEEQGRRLGQRRLWQRRSCPRRQSPAARGRGRGIATTVNVVWAGYVYWAAARLRPYLNFVGNLVPVCIILPTF
jgi:hypothetical protein